MFIYVLILIQGIKELRKKAWLHFSLKINLFKLSTNLKISIFSHFNQHKLQKGSIDILLKQMNDLKYCNQMYNT